MISQKYRKLNFVCFRFSVGNPTSANDSVLLLTNAQPKGTNLNFPLFHSLFIEQHELVVLKKVKMRKL